MKKISISKILFGNPDYINSEKYFVTIATFFSSFFLLVLSIVHVCMQLASNLALIAGGSSLLMLVLYYFVRFHNFLVIPKAILTFGGLLLLDYTWYFKFLSNGPVLFFILIFAALIIWIWEGKQLIFCLVFYFSNLAILYYIDSNATESLFLYPENKSRKDDIYLSLFLYSTLLIVLLNTIKRDSSKKREILRDLNGLYSGIFNNTTIGLYQSTPEGQVLSANPALIKMLEFDSLEDLLKRDLTKGSYVDSGKRSEFKSIIQEKEKITDYISEWYTKNGNILIVLESAKAVRNREGKIIRYDGTVEDITEKQKIQKDLVEARDKAEESDRLKSAFLANMSHEIRTPMNGILGFTELLKEPNLTISEQEEFIRIIENSGQRLLNIINDIIDISKIEANLMEFRMKKTNINKQLDYIYTFFKLEAELKKIRLTIKNYLPAENANIITDTEKLYAILTNLIKNALKYTERGSIELGCIFKSSMDQNELEFYVHDTGMGIPIDRREAIFERFIQSDIENKMANQGAGLGLAISKTYVEELGGRIWVESEEDIGSTFYFTLPYNTDLIHENSDQQSSDSEENKTIKKLKILIVEDDKVSELLLDETISTYSKEIIKARTGIEAIEKCRENPDIDLILMDVCMPEMGGYEAIKQIRIFNKEVIIISQTANALSGDKEKSISAGSNDYITKPINITRLQSMIQKYFKR